jgi:dGTPase
VRFHIEPPRQPFASDWRRSRGRQHPVSPSPTRSGFQRDRDRIIHSTAFRRLKHKTQVFVAHEGDHYRTRLTHSIEVAQIARSISRALGLDEDLAEAIALAHDLGHTPFGHTGEDALDLCLAPHGGFDHNAQALRIVTLLERRYAEHDGLNLAWETLEGLTKHNGPLLRPDGEPVERHAARGLPEDIRAFDDVFPLELSGHAGAEAQAAAIADDIAYDAHDIDDGLRSGLLSLDGLISGVPFVAEIAAEITARHPALETQRLVHEIGRRVITRFVEDVIAESERRITALAPRSVEDVRAADAPVVAFSPAMAAADRSIKDYLYPALYRHRDVMRVRGRAAAIVTDLFERFTDDPATLPAEWRPRVDAAADRAIVARDYIAGMTDPFALGEHRRLFDVTPELR